MLILMIVLLYLFPQFALWLPGTLWSDRRVELVPDAHQ
jgi:hypothetical protein